MRKFLIIEGGDSTISVEQTEFLAEDGEGRSSWTMQYIDEHLPRRLLLKIRELEEDLFEVSIPCGFNKMTTFSISLCDLANLHNIIKLIDKVKTADYKKEGLSLGYLSDVELFEEL
jgi:hypothetical protein